MRVTLELPHAVVKAAKVEGLGARARDRAITDHSFEIGHGQGARQLLWHLNCSQAVAELLLAELKQLRASAPDVETRDACGRVATILKAGLERPLEPWELGHRLIDAATKNRPVQPTVNDAAYLGGLPDPVKPDLLRLVR